MLKKLLFRFIMFVFCVFSTNSYAVYYDPSDEQIRQAIEYGEKNKDTDYTTFLSEWMTVSNDGYEWAALNTKFSILACEAKNAALNMKKLTNTEIISLLLEAEDILSFRVVLYGNSADFTKDYHAVLIYKGKSVQPFSEQNDINSKPANLGIRIPLLYRAVCRYDFPNYYIEPDAEVVLVVSESFKQRKKIYF